MDNDLLKQIREALAECEASEPGGERPRVANRELLIQHVSKLRQKAGIPEGRKKELMAMVRSRRYWRDKDPEIIQEVRERFRALYL